MVEIVARGETGIAPPVSVMPDLVWQTDIESGIAGCADFVVAPDGGLQCLQPFETAIIICLFTDKRAPPEMDEPDRRGWYGDAVDIDRTLGEGDMGSLLWTLERAVLNDKTEQLAISYAHDALQPLIRQGVAERFEITAETDRARGRLGLRVLAFSKTEAFYEGTFGVRSNV